MVAILDLEVPMFLGFRSTQWLADPLVDPAALGLVLVHLLLDVGLVLLILQLLHSPIVLGRTLPNVVDDQLAAGGEDHLEQGQGEAFPRRHQLLRLGLLLLTGLVVPGRNFHHLFHFALEACHSF